MRRCDLVAGPNGSGKSSFVRFTLSRVVPPGTPFVNADEIAERRWPAEPQAHAYEAAAIAVATRSELIVRGEPFMAETVFSHASKLELFESAQTAGFSVFMHVLLVPEDLAVVRVRHRVEAGGHSVPEDKIRQRYRRLWVLVGEGITRAHAATVYDNSDHDGPRIVARFVDGLPTEALRWPAWAPDDLTTRWIDP